MKVGIAIRKQNTERFKKVCVAVCHASRTMVKEGYKNVTFYSFDATDLELCRNTLQEECGAQFVRYVYWK
jgi:hypothetical protein